MDYTQKKAIFCLTCHLSVFMSELKGMTVSERLLIMDELDRFETAIRDKNKQLAIEILSSIEPDKQNVEETVTSMLENPDEFGI